MIYPANAGSVALGVSRSSLVPSTSTKMRRGGEKLVLRLRGAGPKKNKKEKAKGGTMDMDALKVFLTLLVPYEILVLGCACMRVSIVFLHSVLPRMLIGSPPVTLGLKCNKMTLHHSRAP